MASGFLSVLIDWRLGTTSVAISRQLGRRTQGGGIVHSVGDGVTLDVVCEGDPYQMGLAQGTVLREKIHVAMSVLLELEVFRLQKPRWLPLGVYRRLAERKAERYFQQALHGDVGSFTQRLAGIAEGAGVSPRGIALLNVMEAVLSDLRPSTVLPVTAGCSAMAITGSVSKSGDPMMAHNFDYLPQIQPFYCIRENRPNGKLRSLEFTVAPLCGGVDGINQAGLCITNNYAYVTDTNHPAPTVSMLVSDALAHSTTVDEAVDRIGPATRAGGGILMLADAEGQVASLELSSTRSAVRRTNGDADWLAHTNRFQCSEMADVELAAPAVYSKRAPSALRGCRVHDSADERDRRFRERLADRNHLTAKDVGELMADHGPRGEPSLGTICMHSNYWFTTSCVQLFPLSRTMRVAYASACCARFSEFRI